MAIRVLQPIQQFTKKEIEDLLRKGAYAAIMEEDDEGSKFCEEDIDQILLRRTTTITIESEGKGSTFSKVDIFYDDIIYSVWCFHFLCSIFNITNCKCMKHFVDGISQYISKYLGGFLGYLFTHKLI